MSIMFLKGTEFIKNIDLKFKRKYVKNHLIVYKRKLIYGK